MTISALDMIALLCSIVALVSMTLLVMLRLSHPEINTARRSRLLFVDLVLFAAAIEMFFDWFFDAYGGDFWHLLSLTGRGAVTMGIVVLLLSWRGTRRSG